MQQSNDSGTVQHGRPAGVPPVGFAGIAWLVIILISLLIILLHLVSESTEAGQTYRSKISHVTERMEGQVIVGAKALGFGSAVASSLETFNQ